MREDKFTLSLNEFGPADGAAMDFTTTDAFGIPIVSERLKITLSEFKEIHFFPLSVEGQNISKIYYAMTVANFLDCLDEEKSVFSVFTPDDPIRPDRAGDYHSVIKLIVDSEKARGHDILRISRYPNALIVSERVKSALDAGGFTGLDFSLCSE